MRAMSNQLQTASSYGITVCIIVSWIKEDSSFIWWCEKMNFEKLKISPLVVLLIYHRKKVFVWGKATVWCFTINAKAWKELTS